MKKKSHSKSFLRNWIKPIVNPSHLKYIIPKYIKYLRDFHLVATLQWNVVARGLNRRIHIQHPCATECNESRATWWCKVRIA